MPADDRRVFHNKILFCDIVGYARRDTLEQYRCQRYLTEVLRAVLADLSLTLEEDTVALPTGDGLVLNFLVQQPDVHLRTATEVLRHLYKTEVSAGQMIGLRIGLNSDIDTLVADINNKKNIVGNGINLAQRVMDLGRHGQILMHDRVRLDLGNYPDYEGKLVYRGEYVVKHGTRVPVSQFVDTTSDYINSELLPSPMETSLAPATVDLDTILHSVVHGHLLRIVLDPRAHQHLHEVRAYIEDFLDGHGEFQRLKVAVTWVASEMLDNAFRYGNLGPTDTIVLTLDRSKSGIFIATEQPDVPAFDADLALATSEEDVSFMRLLVQRGLRWRQQHETSRLTLSVEIPIDFEIRATTMLPLEHGLAADLPITLKAFINGLVDVCVHEGMSFIRPLGRIDRVTIKHYESLLLHRIQPHSRIILDFARVEYIASLGMRLLMLMARKSRATIGSGIVLASLCGVAREQLEISHITMLFDIYETSEAAFRALARRQPF